MGGHISHPHCARTVLDLEGFVVVEHPEGGILAEFVFPDLGTVPYVRIKDLPEEVRLALIKAATKAPTTWPFKPEVLGSRIFGEAPQRISDWQGPIQVYRPGGRAWAMLVINDHAELFVRLDAIPQSLRQKALS